MAFAMTSRKNNFILTGIERNIIALCLLVCSSVNAFSSDHFISGVKIVTTKLSVDYRISSFLGDSAVYFITTTDLNQNENSLQINSIGLYSGIQDSIIIKLPAEMVISSLPSFAINGTHLLMRDAEYRLFRFRKIINNWKFNSVVAIPKGAAVSEIGVTGKNFLLSEFYNMHPLEKQFNSSVLIYDPVENLFLKEIHPALPCIAFSHLKKEWIANNTAYIAIADPCGYRISLYDTQLRLITSINGPDSSWRKVKGNKIPFNTDVSTIHPRQIVDRLLTFQDSVNRIEKIFFLNDSTLLVSITGFGLKDPQRRIDSWHLGEKINLTSSKIINPQFIRWPDPDIHFNLPFASKINIKNNKIIYLSDTDFTLSPGQDKNNFEILKNNYYIDHDPYFTLFIFDYSPPASR
jgi:hypothetical protein